MGRAGRCGHRGRQGGEERGSGHRLPEVSAQERDFWRRAVAEERERLELAGQATHVQRPDLH
jgi:hypothetical protein